MEPGSTRARSGRRGRTGGIALALLLLALGASVVGGVWGCSAQTAVRRPPGASSAAGPPATATRPPTTAAPATTTTTAPILFDLKVVTHPAEAEVVLTGPARSLGRGRTPWKGEVPAGRLHLSIRKAGRNPINWDLTLKGKKSIDVWLDPAGQILHKVGQFDCGAAPKQVAYSPDGRELWISLLGGRGVEVFDAKSGARVASVPLGKHGAVEVIFSRDGRTVYASQMETASVYEIDRADRTVRRVLATNGSWTKVMALSPDEGTLFAANWSSNDVSEIDLASGAVRRRIPTVVTPRGLYVTPDAKRLFVAGYEHGELQVIDLATGKGRVLVRTGGAFRHLVGDDERGLIYVDDMALDTVHVVNVADESVRLLAETDEKPNTIDLSPDGRVLYVSNRGENNPKSYYIPGPEWGSVLAIDTATGTVLDAIVGGNQTTGLDVSPDGTTLAFSDFLDNRVQLYAVPPYETLTAGDGGRATSHLADLKK